MEVIILQDQEQVSELVARRIQNLITSKPAAVLGLATGSTPLNLYQKLVAKFQNKEISFAEAISFNLDEYVGIESQNMGSYRTYMEKNFFAHVDMKPENIFIPNGMAADLQQECKKYEETIHNKGPIDLQILGIGRDGHIGFNEPVSSLQSRTRLKTLTELTRKDNATYFRSEEAVPFHVITMGIATVLSAREIVLMALGSKKADAVAKMVEGPLTAMVSASALQWHPKAKIIIDQAAATKLKNTEYYQWVYEKKPVWQKAEFT